MKIVLATQNRNKVEELQSCLKDLNLKILSLDDFPKMELQETGATLRENALQKGRRVAAKTGEWALADDTGLFVDALDGKPGIFSARYAGEKATAKENIEKLLKEMKNIPEEKRQAHFLSLLALVHPDGREITVQGKLEGMITKEMRGERGFGYDPVFFLSDHRCTLAEISLEEKNRISHRGLALSQMRSLLERLSK